MMYGSPIRAQPGDILLIENPEIHLHPGVQSRLGDFFPFLAKRGVQLFIETHCGHMFSRVRFEIYKKNIDSSLVAVLYKPSRDKPFQPIGINSRGHFMNCEDAEIRFPGGFFDSTLKELLEIS